MGQCRHPPLSATGVNRSRIDHVCAKRANNSRERVQQSTGQHAPKQTNDGQGPSIVSIRERIDSASDRLRTAVKSSLPPYVDIRIVAPDSCVEVQSTTLAWQDVASPTIAPQAPGLCVCA